MSYFPRLRSCEIGLSADVVLVGTTTIIWDLISGQLNDDGVVTIDGAGNITINQIGTYRLAMHMSGDAELQSGNSLVQWASGPPAAITGALLPITRLRGNDNVSLIRQPNGQAYLGVVTVTPHVFTVTASDSNWDSIHARSRLIISEA